MDNLKLSITSLLSPFHLPYIFINSPHYFYISHLKPLPRVLIPKNIPLLCDGDVGVNLRDVDGAVT